MENSEQKNTNAIYLETFSRSENGQITVPLETLVIYLSYTYCKPDNIAIYFVLRSIDTPISAVGMKSTDLILIEEKDIPWTVALCDYPVAYHNHTVITGLCAVARHISNHRTSVNSSYEHIEGLLGFRKSCLQAPNEVSIWTKFCEVDMLSTVKSILSVNEGSTVPQDIVRFENHLSKPVRVHNVYKLAREIKKEEIFNGVKTKLNEDLKADPHKIPQYRQWKSKMNLELERINSSIPIEELEIEHQFAEGPFLTLADIILLPIYSILVYILDLDIFQIHFPLTCKWYKHLLTIEELKPCLEYLPIITKLPSFQDLIIPQVENVSLYKCDPKRHNPKRRVFTKEDDIEMALSCLLDGMEISNSDNNINLNTINWSDLPDGANPTAGHLPDKRMDRKSQQLENLALSVVELAQDGDVIVDFCSGSGHLGILLAYLLPKCTIILLENKEQSLVRAKKRALEMKITNVYFYQCNLNFFIGKFDIGVALHACGVASDLVLNKCLEANAKFVLCPCCYGSLHETDKVVYPRSKIFKKVPLDKYLCMGHAADQTHEDHPLAKRGARCMNVIDSDRGHLAQEAGYQVTLSRLKPLSCTPKNNLLIGIPL